MKYGIQICYDLTTLIIATDSLYISTYTESWFENLFEFILTGVKDAKSLLGYLLAIKRLKAICKIYGKKWNTNGNNGGQKNANRSHFKC